MIVKSRSFMLLIGEINDDLVTRVHERVMQTLRHFKITYCRDSISIIWADLLSPPAYSCFIEDVTSLFHSANIPA
jgi:hypothetical protein